MVFGGNDNLSLQDLFKPSRTPPKPQENHLFRDQGRLASLDAAWLALALAWLDAAWLALALVWIDAAWLALALGWLDPARGPAGGRVTRKPAVRQDKPACRIPAGGHVNGAF